MTLKVVFLFYWESVFISIDLMVQTDFGSDTKIDDEVPFYRFFKVFGLPPVPHLLLLSV